MINSVVLQGRLTKDPELRHTQSGKAVVTFTLAWSEKFNETERKLFLPCVAWGGTAEFVTSYFGKGSALAVEGKLGSRSWTDKEGRNRETIELTVSQVHFTERKEATVAPSEVPIVHAPFEELTDEAMDLPF